MSKKTEFKVIEKVIDPREDLFVEIMKSFGGNPIKVFQVGAIESFDIKFKIGSGWSDITFGQWIRNSGGEITVVDINESHLNNSILAAEEHEYKINTIHGDATDHMKAGYDIYYLDGSNCAEQTLNQFKKIENEKCVVLVDDFDIKGTLLKEYLKNKKQNYFVSNLYNTIAKIDLRWG